MDRKERSLNGSQATRRRRGGASFCSCNEARARRVSSRRQGFKIPEPLRMDQNEICVALERAMLSGGKTATAARKLLEVLQPHLLKEEMGLLHVLGALRQLLDGELTPEMGNIPLLTERLKAERFNLAREHERVLRAARGLRRSAEAEAKTELASFTEHLALRAWMDEVVFYPAAILLGDYLKLRLQQGLSGREPLEER